MRLHEAIVALGLALMPLTLTAQPNGSAVPPSAAAKRALLLNPTHAFWKTRAPDTVTADMETSRGTITLELVRDWAPNAVDRFYNLARAGYYDDSRFYRVLWGYVAQFGAAGNPAVLQAWSRKYLPADAPRQKNLRGTLAFAQSKPTDRTAHVFINLGDNAPLDSMKFTPFGRVIAGMDAADSIYTKYGEVPTTPSLGDPKRLYYESNRYLDKEFPKLDRIIRITIRGDGSRTK